MFIKKILLAFIPICRELAFLSISKKIRHFFLYMIPILIIVMGIGFTYYFSYSNVPLSICHEYNKTRTCFVERFVCKHSKRKSRTCFVERFVCKHSKRKSRTCFVERFVCKHSKRKYCKNYKKYKRLEKEAFKYWKSLIIIDFMLFVIFSIFFYSSHLPKYKGHIFFNYAVPFCYIYFGVLLPFNENHVLFLIMVGYSLIEALPIIEEFRKKGTLFDLCSAIGISITFASTAFSVRVPFGAMLIFWCVYLVPIVYISLLNKQKCQ